MEGGKKRSLLNVAHDTDDDHDWSVLTVVYYIRWVTINA